MKFRFLWILITAAFYSNSVLAAEDFNIDSYPEIKIAILKFNPKLEDFYIIEIEKLTSKHETVLVKAVSNQKYIRELQSQDVDIHTLLKQESFGLFVIESQTKKISLILDIFPTKRFLDYEVEIKSFSKSHITITGKGRNYGDSRFRKKYEFDLNTLKVK